MGGPRQVSSPQAIGADDRQVGGRQAIGTDGPARSAAELAALAAGCLVGLAAAGLLARAGAPALLGGLTLFVALNAAIAAALALALRRAARG